MARKLTKKPVLGQRNIHAILVRRTRRPSLGATVHPLLKFALIVIVGLASFGPNSLLATPSPFQLESTVVWNYGVVATRGMTRGDFTGDGVNELAFISASPDRLLVVYGQEEGEWQPLQRTLIEPDGESQIALTWPRPSPLRPALVLVEVNQWLPSPSTASVYSGWPLREIQRFEVPGNVFSATIADADGDGQVELVAATYSGTYAYSLETGALLWSIDGGAFDVLVDRFSPIQPPQIVVSGFLDGIVYDGSTRTEQWRYPGGFGTYLASGRFDNSGFRQLVGAFDWDRLTVFSAAPWLPLWQFNRVDIDAVTTADLDGDDIDEIIQGDGQWGDVNVIDAASRTIRFPIDSPGHGTAAIVVGDLTGDSTHEIAFGPRHILPVDVALRITNASGEALHDLMTLEGGGIALAAGNLLGDGIDRLVTASAYRGIALRNVETGEADWMTPTVFGGIDDPFAMQIRVIRLAQLDADPALEVVLAGLATGGRIAVFDPSSREVQLQIGLRDSGPMRERAIVDAELLDFDDDDRDDLIVATEARTTSSSGVKLEVYSLQDGTKLWETITMGSGFLQSRGVMIVPATLEADPLLVAALPGGLQAYNARTRLPEWALNADVRAAEFFPDGLSGPEFVVAGADGKLRFYDLATRSLQRSFFVGAVDEIHPIAGENDVLLKADGRLRVFSATGVDLGESDIVGTLGFGTSVLQRTSASGSEILAGTPAGYLKFLYRPGRLFGNGFE